MDKIHPRLTVLGFLYPILLVFTVSFKNQSAKPKAPLPLTALDYQRQSANTQWPQGERYNWPVPEAPLLGRKQTADLGPDSN